MWRKPSRQQLDLEALAETYGGMRPRGGRPRGRTTVARERRPDLGGGEPVQVTLRLLPDLPPLHRPRMDRALRDAFRLGGDKPGFRLLRTSVESNQLHLVCEAADRRALTRGVQGLAIRIARRINRAAKRSGKVFADRYDVTVPARPSTPPVRALARAGSAQGERGR